jgi:hypothetical protein
MRKMSIRDSVCPLNLYDGKAELFDCLVINYASNAGGLFICSPSAALLFTRKNVRIGGQLRQSHRTGTWHFADFTTAVIVQYSIVCDRRIISKMSGRIGRQTFTSIVSDRL